MKRRIRPFPIMVSEQDFAEYVEEEGRKKMAKKVTARAAKNPFRLEVGKTYVIRNGRKAKVTRREGIRDSICEFQGTVGIAKCSWRKDGAVWDKGESAYDILREYIPAKSKPSPPSRGKRGKRKVKA